MVALETQLTVFIMHIKTNVMSVENVSSYKSSHGMMFNKVMNMMRLPWKLTGI